MKIAVLGPVTWRTPPDAYGPWERFVFLLTEGLVERGLDVTLFASLDSKTRAKLDGVVQVHTGEGGTQDPLVQNALNIAHCFKKSSEFDIVHNNVDWLPLAMGQFCKAKMLTTVHGFHSQALLPAYVEGSKYSKFVSISNSDRSKHLNYEKTIYHGIDFKNIKFSQDPQGYLLVFGRIDHEKGVAEAIEIASLAKKQLVICGHAYDKKYWDEKVAPHVDNDKVKFLGNVPHNRHSEVLGGASALLHPINFDEPFGLSVVEAMAYGTPVIAFNRGSMPEVINNGTSGFLVNNIGEAVDAVKDLGKINRESVHEYCKEHFSADRMVDEYIKVYDSVLKNIG